MQACGQEALQATDEIVQRAVLRLNFGRACLRVLPLGLLGGGGLSTLGFLLLTLGFTGQRLLATFPLR
ncbi:hypothetical protein DV20_30425 [Amycolatopsis rifamycinica]|uniref:Uncharacterized protein n=1 Tax=Amycolatopsis rifamycinica TaxID=287986 RepID=A0A066U2N6_9PSEU|nr:hypothetical protein DV20_30425 [Amycolatopsis rifamycinica]